MTDPASATTHEILAVGSRFHPWGTRAMMGIVTAALVGIYYSVIGPPTTSVAAAAWLLIPTIVVPLWVFTELVSERSVSIRPEGVTILYPSRVCFIPWDRFQLSSIQTYPRWARTVTFLEVDRPTGLIRQRAHEVTPEQAKVLLEAMPNPPQTAFVQRLLAGRDQTAARYS